MSNFCYQHNIYTFSSGILWLFILFLVAYYHTINTMLYFCIYMHNDKNFGGDVRKFFAEIYLNFSKNIRDLDQKKNPENDQDPSREHDHWHEQRPSSGLQFRIFDKKIWNFSKISWFLQKFIVKNIVWSAIRDVKNGKIEWKWFLPNILSSFKNWWTQNNQRMGIWVPAAPLSSMIRSNQNIDHTRSFGKCAQNCRRW